MQSASPLGLAEVTFPWSRLVQPAENSLNRLKRVTVPGQSWPPLGVKRGRKAEV